jgi:hypothetical protein
MHFSDKLYAGDICADINVADQVAGVDQAGVRDRAGFPGPQGES